MLVIDNAAKQAGPLGPDTQNCSHGPVSVHNGVPINGVQADGVLLRDTLIDYRQSMVGLSHHIAGNDLPEGGHGLPQPL